MIKFKKQFMACILTAAMAVCTFATVTPANAATPTAKQYITKMGKAVKKANSYELKQTSKMTGSMMGQSVDVTETQKQIYFKKPAKIKTVATSKSTAYGTSTTTKSVSYAKKASDGHYYLYQSSNGGAYTKMDITDLTSQTLNWDASSYSSAKIVKNNVKVSGINTVQISAKVKGKALGEIFGQLGLGDLFSQVGIDFSTMKPIKVTLWIDKKTYRPVKIKSDSTDFINDYMETLYSSMGMSGYGGTYSKLVATTTYSKFNKATNFKIPSSCK